MVGHGWARPGRAGRGGARHGKDAVRLGSVWPGRARQGRGEARSGAVWLGEARYGMAGLGWARQGPGITDVNVA